MKFPRLFSGFISVFLIFSIVFQLTAFPISTHFVKKAEAGAVDAMLKDFVGDAATGLISCAATWGISFAINSIMGLTTDVPSTDKNAISQFIYQNCLQPMARQIALGVLQKLTESTVNWINGGFNGNPFYVRDLGSYLTSVSNDVVRKATYELKIGDDSYGVNLSLSSGLINGYLSGNQTKIPKSNLDKLLGQSKAEAFTAGDFTQGGWDAWLATTIIPQNNPIGHSFISADILNRTITKKAEENKQDIAQNDGFLSMKKCLQKEEIDGEEKCAKWETATPGSMISDQLKDTAKTNKDTLLNTEDLAESIMSIFTALMTSIMTEGVSSSSSNYQGDFGGYGSNDPNEAPIAGSGSDWTNAGGYTQGLINLDDLESYRIIQQTIMTETAILLPKIQSLIDKLYEADYCVPGPRADWFEISKEKLSAYLSEWVPDTDGASEDWILQKFGAQANVSSSEGNAPKIKKLTMRALEGGPLNGTDNTYEKGLKDFMNEKYNLINNIPVAFSIYKEFREVEDYSILMNFNSDRSDEAYVFITRLDYIEKEYNKLPPDTDPTYQVKRKALQELADTLLTGIYKESVINGIRGQIKDADGKYLYLTNTDETIAPKGLIHECIEQLQDYPNVQRNRRPYPEMLLPASVQAIYQVSGSGFETQNSTTFLPGVYFGVADGTWPDPNDPAAQANFNWQYILLSDYYGITSSSTDTSVFEQYLNIY